MNTHKNLFENIVHPENLFWAWDSFKQGKRNKKDVRLFEFNLEENIFKLQRDLKNKTYRHGNYHSFTISDPKPRNINKAQVRDRIVHHAVFQVLNPIFEDGFIPTSFSCRVDYGTHKGVRVLQDILRKVSRNGTRQCFALKCDIKNFFDTIDHDILFSILTRKIRDTDTNNLLWEIIFSFSSHYSDAVHKKGVPIGNLTSQIFANVYMNKFDQFIKNELRVKYYLRYTDDFLIISENKEYLENLLPRITVFLQENLLLKIHEDKTKIRKVRQGIDFLGYVDFVKYKLVRNKTKKRILKKFHDKIKDYQSGIISKNSLSQSLQSYLGFLSHADSHETQEYFKHKFWSLD